MEEGSHILASTLTALYLPGFGSPLRAARHRWFAVERCLRLELRDLGRVQTSLERAGFWMEAGHLCQAGLLTAAEKLVCKGRVLTAADERYPARWLSLLGSGAPPALWRSGEMPPGPFFTVVGARDVPATALRFAFEAARSAVASDFVVSSGGAKGCDRAAAQGALSASAGSTALVEILAAGFSRVRREGRCVLALLPPGAEFSSAVAMERNSLLYALSDRSLVAHARLREGGAWQGAAECLRRRLSHVLVRSDPASSAAKALVALGATALDDPAQALTVPISGPQGELVFG